MICYFVFQSLALKRRRAKMWEIKTGGVEESAPMACECVRAAGTWQRCKEPLSQKRGWQWAASAEILRWRWRLDGKPSQPSLARGKDNLQRGKGSEQKWNKACWRIECNLAKKGLAFVTFSLREQRLHVWESVQDCKLKKGKKTYQQECWIEIKSKHPYRSLENQRLPVITSLRPQIAASQSVKKKHINLKISLHVNSRSMMIYWWYRVRSLDLKSSAWAVIQE